MEIGIESGRVFDKIVHTLLLLLPLLKKMGKENTTEVTLRGAYFFRKWPLCLSEGNYRMSGSSVYACICVTSCPCVLYRKYWIPLIFISHFSVTCVLLLYIQRKLVKIKISAITIHYYYHALLSFRLSHVFEFGISFGNTIFFDFLARRRRVLPKTLHSHTHTQRILRTHRSIYRWFRNFYIGSVRYQSKTRGLFVLFV